MEYIDTTLLRIVANDTDNTSLLSCSYDGKDYDNIKIIRCFPSAHPFEFLSIMTEKNEEIGIIRHLEDLDKDSKELVIKDLELRYFIPVIEKITKRVTRRGYTMFDCLTNCGNKTVKINGDLVYSIQTYKENDLLIKDCEDNYYIIKDYKGKKDKHIKYILSYI